MDDVPRFERLLALKPTEILIPETPGQENPREIYATIGYALTQWEKLEESLCRLFEIYLDAPHPAVARAYGSIVSNKARVSMLVEVINSKFGFNQAEGAKLHIKAMNQIGALAGRRNEIAHGIVSNTTVNGESFGFCLMPPFYNSVKTLSAGDYFSRYDKNADMPQTLRSFLSQHKYCYTEHEILKYAKMFEVATDDVWQMYIHLFQQLADNQQRSAAQKPQE